MRWWQPRRWGTLVLAALVLAACGGGAGASDDETTIVVTTTILGDLVGRVAGDEAHVEVLMPAGADPHEFQASSQQVAAMASADLVVANGLGLEEGLLAVLEGAEADGIHVLEVGLLVSPIGFGESGACDPSEKHDHESDADHDEEGLACDPHVWMDPVRMAGAADIIADELAGIDEAGSWRARADDYAAELVAADVEIEQILADVRSENRKLVTNHDTLGYFSSRYGFEVIGTVVPGGSTLADPSSEELAALVEAIRATGVPAIFAETIAPTALAEAVAGELGGAVEVVVLSTDSLGEPGSETGTLAGMLVANARRIADALSEAEG